MRHERALRLRSHASQHHKRIGERAEEDAERRLIAPVAGEVAQQPRPHLAGRERQGGDGDGEDGARDPDCGGSDGAQQRARAGAAAAVEPKAVDQPPRHYAAAVQVHEAERQQYSRQHDRCRQEPECLAEVAQQLAESYFTDGWPWLLGGDIEQGAERLEQHARIELALVETGRLQLALERAMDGELRQAQPILDGAQQRACGSAAGSDADRRGALLNSKNSSGSLGGACS